jgi:hypothetical protein
MTLNVALDEFGQHQFAIDFKKKAISIFNVSFSGGCVHD